MDNNYSGKLVEILPNRLYWFSDARPPKINRALFFCLDTVLKYNPYFSDFGPFNIQQVLIYSSELENLLSLEEHKNSMIVHYTSNNGVYRLNAAFVMGSFMVS